MQDISIDTLLSGQEVIAEKERRIQTLVSIVKDALGLPSDPLQTLRVRIGGTGEELGWTVTNHRGQLSVICTVGVGTYAYSNNPDAEANMGARGILIAHDALPMFLEGMLERFPELTELLKPWTDSANEHGA